MPQLDKVTFFVQSISVFLSFISVYYLFIYYLLPDVQLGLKQRKLLIDSLILELNLIKFKFNLHMKLSLHLVTLNKKVFLDYFLLKKEQKNQEYFFIINQMMNNDKGFSRVLEKVLFKFLLLKNIHENNSQLIKK